jgi:hypothetical protein
MEQEAHVGWVSGCRAAVRPAAARSSGELKGAVALGGSAGGGELTPFGHQVVEQYRAIEGKAHNAVAGELPALAAATARSDC